MAMIRKHLGQRVLFAERLERREMLSGDGLVAAPIAAAPVEAVVVVAGDNLQQQIRADDRDQVHDRVRDFRCAARPALEALVVQGSLGDQLQQRDQLRIDDPLQTQLQTQLRTKMQSQATTSSLEAAALSSAMDQLQVRDRDQLKDGTCDQSPDKAQDRDRTRLQTTQLTATASISVTTGVQQRDRVQVFDGLRDRDQLQKRDQSCISVVMQPLVALV